MAKFSLNIAEQERVKLTQQQQENIVKIYQEASKAVGKKAKTLPKTPSAPLKEWYLKELQKEINLQLRKAEKSLEDQIKGNMAQISQTVVDEASNFNSKVGLKVEGAYFYVPDEIVKTLSTGKLYSGDWSLSNAIWNTHIKARQSINNVVAQGIAENKSAYDIAKDLEKYLNPEAKKDWDWSKVYPGSAKRIDYNAQRLARTMVSHAYQQSFVKVTQNNPFVQDYVWLAAGGNRTCEVCMERDGKHFPKDNLPLDHPNGMCTFEAYIPDSMTQIADRLADWAQGKKDPELDNWYQSMVGNPSGEGVTKEQRKKATTSKDVIFGSTKWIDKNFSNMRKSITREFGKESWVPIRDKLGSLNETQLRWLSSGNSRLKELINDRGRGYYSSRDRLISVDLLKDISPSNEQGPFSTLFHEYGHLLDDKYGPSERGLSSLGDFGKAIYKSLQTEYNNIVDKSTGKITQRIRDSLMGDDHSSGVQDIISGLSGDSNRIKWGHSSKYWARRGADAWMEVTSEAFANMNSAYINGGKAEQYFEEVFPESYKLFKEEVANIVQQGITKTVG